MQKKQTPPNFDAFYENAWNVLQYQLNKKPEVAKQKLARRRPSNSTLDLMLLPNNFHEIGNDDADDSDNFEEPLDPPSSSVRTTTSIPSTSSPQDNSSYSDNIVSSDNDDQIAAKWLESMLFVRSKIQGNTSLNASFPIPRPPRFDVLQMQQRNVVEKLTDIQNYLDSLSYNHFGSVFTICKGAASKDLMKLAQQVCRFGLPIKCLEAVVVAVYLSNGLYEVDRQALSFKSKCEGSTYRHIVLVVKHKGMFGALGLSRRQDLMFKPLEFESIEDLVEEFQQCYSRNKHTLIKVKIGGTVAHDHTSKVEGFPWPNKVLTLKKDVAEIAN